VLGLALERHGARLARPQVLLEIDVAREPQPPTQNSATDTSVPGNVVSSVLPMPSAPGKTRSIPNIRPMPAAAYALAPTSRGARARCSGKKYRHYAERRIMRILA
jgi:hypothetical protein